MLYAFIPARYASTRLPGKPLLKIKNKTMLEWVYSGVKPSKLIDKIIILTDDERIKLSSEKFLNTRDEVIMTPKDLNSGTERIAYFLKKNKEEAKKIDFVLNIQGDEPLIDVDIVDTIAKLTISCSKFVPMATLFKKSKDKESFYNRNVVKLVLDKDLNALYFSRASIPSFKTEPDDISFLKHIGIYGYLKDFVLKYLDLPSSELEKQESLEQLRVLEHGFKIKTAEITKELIGIDTKEDLKELEKITGT